MGTSAVIAGAIFGAGAATNIFKSGPMPTPEKPVEFVDPNAGQAERDAAAYEERRKRGQSGRASTTLTGGLGDTSAPTLASKVLLGA
jgi:hypothetical protein